MGLTGLGPQPFPTQMKDDQTVITERGARLVQSWGEGLPPSAGAPHAARLTSRLVKVASGDHAENQPLDPAVWRTRGPWA